jgi:hypothetical protein
MRRIVIAAASALGMLGALLVGTVATGGTASAGCDNGEVYYKFVKLGKFYRTTAMRSDWANGGQTVTVSKGSTASKRYRTVTTQTHTIDVGAEWGPIKASYNYQHTSTDDVTTSKSVTLSESYSVKVPKAKTAREMRWARVMRFRVIKEKTVNPCTVKVIGKATVEAPLAGRTFVWDYQDDDTGLPGCRVKGYPSYGHC